VAAWRKPGTAGKSTDEPASEIQIGIVDLKLFEYQIISKDMHDLKLRPESFRLSGR
jgi:hypothetical protein